MTDAETAPAPPETAPAVRPAIACPRCGAPVAGDQSWCLECGLAARTRLARTPRWRAPLVLAAAIGLVAMVALVVAFLVLTGDNAPLPTTAAPAPAAATTVVETTPPATTTAAGTPTTPDATPTESPTSTAPATGDPSVGTTPTVPAGTPTATVPAP
ncbi:MAG: hypothetical protein ACJ762_18940 [Solirubrobacteraceae bacterium]